MKARGIEIPNCFFRAIVPAFR